MDPTEFASLASLIMDDARSVVELARRVTKSNRSEHRKALHNSACISLLRGEENYQLLERTWARLAISRDKRYNYAIGAANNAMRFARVELAVATQFLFQKEIER